MRRFALGFCALLAPIAVLAMVAGCSSSTDHPGGGQPLPDGFISNTCSSDDECAGMPCKTGKCNKATMMCDYKDKLCVDETACSKGVCDPSSDSCVQQPANEGMSCTASTSEPGSCQAGNCNPLPNCALATSFNDYLGCTSPQYTVAQADNTPGTFGVAMPIVSSYPCAPTESGPEYVYSFFPPLDGDVTVVLRPLNDDGTPATTDDKDLDLIILEDTCSSLSTCMNPMLGGGGYQGVTDGTAKERVTFHANSMKSYYFVVDGKDMNQTRKFEIEIEACGTCQPTDATRLDCNMTTPINASTATGAANLTDYTCGPSFTAVSSAGKEIPFYFRTTDGATRNVTASLTGASADFNLFALPIDYNNQCDPTSCIDYTSGTSGSKSLTWAVNANFSPFTRNWVIVDTPGTTDITFGLELSCAPYCVADMANTLSCNGSFDTTMVNSTTVPPTGSAQSTQYGNGAACGGVTGKTGPETAILFTPTITGTKTYQIELQASTVDLSMVILDAGTSMSPACDPTSTCASFTAASISGSTGTLTTNIASNKTAAANLTAESGHSYYIVVDGTDPAGGAFTLAVSGTQTGSHCGM